MSAVLPLTVQSVSVVVRQVGPTPPPIRGGVAADGAVGQRGRAAVVVQAAAADGGGVAADGAVGQRGRAVVGCTGRRRRDGGVAAEVQLVSVSVPLLLRHAAAAAVAELPLTVQSVSVSRAAVEQAAAVAAGVAPGDRQSRDRRGDTPRRSSNTRLWLLPLMASRLAPGPVMVMFDVISGSSVPPRVIVWAVRTRRSRTRSC